MARPPRRSPRAGSTRPRGANTIKGADVVAKAPADGDTFMIKASGAKPE